MTANVGKMDKVFRVVLGVGILAAGLATQSWWGLVGLIPIAVAGVGFCPLYPLFGVNTCRAKTKEQM